MSRAEAIRNDVMLVTWDHHLPLVSFIVRLIDIHVETLLFVLLADVSQQFRIIISNECLRVHPNEFAFVAPEMLGTGRSVVDLVSSRRWWDADRIFPSMARIARDTSHIAGRERLRH